MSFSRGSSDHDMFIPLCVPEIDGSEWEYIKHCLDTNWVSSVGEFVDRFEKAVADFVGIKRGIATVNGTSALHVALLVAGVKPEDEVVIPSLSFIAPANAVRYIGAWPVFMDVEPSYWQLDTEKMADFFEKECRFKDGSLVNRTSGRVIRAILPVHILGHPCDMDSINELACKYDLAVIEDATESLGAKYHNTSVGHLGHIACFSFNGNKLITTGGGGMIVTDNDEWADRAKYLTTQAKDDPVEYYHEEIGYNYRLSNIQAAMGVAQMEKIESFIEKKKRIADIYYEAFNNSEYLDVMNSRPDVDPVYWLYTVLLQENATIDYRKTVIDKLNENQIGARPLWHPIPSLPPYRYCQAYKVEVSNDLYKRGISLPSSVGLSLSDQHRSISKLLSILNQDDA